MKEPVVMSWSGGKDSAMALHELLRSDSYQVVSLLTSVSEEHRRISHHGVRESLLDEQAKAIGMTLAAEYEISPRFSIFGRIDNLTDEQYSEVFGFPALGRAVYGGAKLRF